MKRIDFSLGGGYAAHIGSGALALIGTEPLPFSGRKAAVVTDSGIPLTHVSACVRELKSICREVCVLLLPRGEEHKRLSTLERIYGFLYEHSFTRSDAIVGVGGGVVLDVAGFAAATYLRGLGFISVPTTIIAQTDSAYGGKTGVDFADGKNHIGVFAHPKAVFCDTDLLATLPERERICGMGEVIKYGAIAQPKLLERLGREIPGEEVIFSCVSIKRGLCEQDERDMGLRRILNFGHTYGHAFEAASGFTLPHGQAVAYGMLAAVRIGEGLGVTGPGVYEAISAACAACGLDTSWQERLPGTYRFLSRDKKSDGDLIDFVLLEALGKPVRLKLALEKIRLD